MKKHDSSGKTSTMPLGRSTTLVPRLAAAGLILIGGVIHLGLWAKGYRQIPTIGPLFLANAAVSALIATALVFTANPRVAMAGVAVSIGSLGALTLSRTVGLFGFTEGWTIDSWRTVAAEVGALVAIATTMTARRNRMLLRSLIPLQTHDARQG